MAILVVFLGLPEVIVKGDSSTPSEPDFIVRQTGVVPTISSNQAGRTDKPVDKTYLDIHILFLPVIFQDYFTPTTPVTTPTATMISTATPVPSTESFRFEPIAETGPIDNILGVGPFSLVNIFSGETSATSTGDLTRCDFAGQCRVTFTVIRTDVTREIGKTVNCEF